MLCKMPGGQWRTGLASLDLCTVGAPSGRALLAPPAERSSAVSGLQPLTARPRGAARDFDALRASKSSPRSAQKKACFLLGTAGAEAGKAGLRAAPPLRAFYNNQYILYACAAAAFAVKDRNPSFARIGRLCLPNAAAAQAYK